MKQGRTKINRNREQKLKQRIFIFFNNLQKLILLGLCQPLSTMPHTMHRDGYGNTSHCIATNLGIYPLGEESESPHN